MSRGPFKAPPSPKHPERDLLGGHTQAPPRLRQVSLIRTISGENTGAGSLGQVRRGGGRKGGTGDCYPMFGGEGDGKQDGGRGGGGERVPACLTCGPPTKGNNSEGKTRWKEQKGCRGDERMEEGRGGLHKREMERSNGRGGDEGRQQ